MEKGNMFSLVTENPVWTHCCSQRSNARVKQSRLRFSLIVLKATTMADSAPNQID